MEHLREMIRNWYSIGRGNYHPLDNARFYGIVIESEFNKLDFSIFEEELSNDCEEDEINKIYSRYEVLWDFQSFMKNK